MNHEKTAFAARGKWRGILAEFGVPRDALSGNHTGCPVCGGKDRFRFDNKEQRGTFYCTNCGAGDGMQLAMKVTGQSFQEVASRIDVMVGNLKPESAPVRVEQSPQEKANLLRHIWSGSKPVQKGDLVDRYLASRGIDQPSYPKTLRFHPGLSDGEGAVRPCMLALVGIYGEAQGTAIHRTYLRNDGGSKAEMASPRKVVGELPQGVCVALSEYTGGPLGIAEGIETALSASALYDMPVWAAINTNALEKWSPPQGCDEIAIFGDNDLKFGGQAAAYRLAHKLACHGLGVTVHFPEDVGKDWNDVQMDRARMRNRVKQKQEQAA